MDIYEALSTDHRLFESLLDRLVTTSKAGDEQWKVTLDDACVRRRASGLQH